MFGFGRLGWPELIIILAIALLIFGPRKLPQISRAIGKVIREFRGQNEPPAGGVDEGSSGNDADEGQNQDS